MPGRSKKTDNKKRSQKKKRDFQRGGEEGVNVFLKNEDTNSIHLATKYTTKGKDEKTKTYYMIDTIKITKSGDLISFGLNKYKELDKPKPEEQTFKYPDDLETLIGEDKLKNITESPLINDTSRRPLVKPPADDGRSGYEEGEEED